MLNLFGGFVGVLVIVWLFIISIGVFFGVVDGV